MNYLEIPRLIDLSCVRTQSAMPELKEMVQLAKTYRFICVFAMPCFTPWLADQIRDEPDILLGGTTGFPSGADSTEIKVTAARRLTALGCQEIDMVINVGALKSGYDDIVKKDILAVKDAVGDIPLKTILEVSLLTDDEIRRGSLLAVEGGASFVNPGTGWCGPTTLSHIRLIRETIGTSAKIKAAGGIRTLQTLEEMVEAGCSRFGIGVHSAASILKEAGLWKPETDDTEEVS